MNLLARITAVLMFVTAWAFEAETAAGGGEAIPVPAVAKFCGNVIVDGERKGSLFLRMQAEGCDDVRFVHIADGRWLGYGVKVLVGESDRDGRQRSAVSGQQDIYR